MQGRPWSRAEERLHEALLKAGVEHRLNDRIYGIRPDVAIMDRRIAAFVDGCFWHGCVEHYRHPDRDRQRWNRRLRETAVRDRRDTLVLEQSGWTVLRYWEHEIYDPSVLQRIVTAIARGRIASAPDPLRVIAIERAANGSEVRRVRHLRAGGPGAVVRCPFPTASPMRKALRP